MTPLRELFGNGHALAHQGREIIEIVPSGKWCILHYF
jgi:hypothetical protein